MDFLFCSSNPSYLIVAKLAAGLRAALVHELLRGLLVLLSPHGRKFATASTALLDTVEEHTKRHKRYETEDASDNGDLGRLRETVEAVLDTTRLLNFLDGLGFTPEEELDM